jgi:glycosyltransferase involved in cell wall biosynthesis
MSLSKPKVSVILTSFNHEKYLREAIDSVLAQTFTDYELIIWDDASTDNSWDIIRSYNHPRIKFFRNHVQRRGIYGINKAITEVAGGKYIAIHHSDDFWNSEKLYKQVEVLDSNPAVGAVFSNVQLVDDFGVIVNEPDRFYSSDFLDQKNKNRFEWLNSFFVNGNSLCHPSVLVRKECYSLCGLYNPAYGQLGDFDMWVRLCSIFEIYVSEEKLVNFRVQASFKNTSSNTNAARERTKNEFNQIIKLFRKICKDNNIFKVFPHAAKYQNKNLFDSEYVLARIALESRFSCVRAFGLNLLYEILEDDARRHFVEINHKFCYVDLIEISGAACVFDVV